MNKKSKIKMYKNGSYVTLDGEIDNGECWYFVLSDEEGWEYQKEIQEIYGVEDLNYLKEKVNKLNKEREQEQ